MVKLLSPAGDLQKLKYAVMYGADSVYLGGKNFGMRANAGNFSDEELKAGIEFAHKNNVQVNVTVNIAARNDDIKSIVKYAKELYKMGADSLIVADTGVIYAVKNAVPEMFLTLSTQMSTTNYESLKFWKGNGISRVVLARELPFSQIKYICANRPKDMEIEVFVHGAMCISYSGRCLLSNYLTGRDSNRGDCAQPCRWQYSLMEKTREGQYFDIEENDNGTFIFNSKDLCLIEHIPELIDAGVDSFKIEGRMKSIYYVSTVTNAYKTAIQRAMNKSENYKWDDLYEELTKVSHRQYTKAFFYNHADSSSQNYGTSSYTRNYDFIAEVVENTDEIGRTQIVQRNKFAVGDVAEVISPGKTMRNIKIAELFDSSGQVRTEAPHPAELLTINTEDNIELKKYDLIRRKCPL